MVIGDSPAVIHPPEGSGAARARAVAKSGIGRHFAYYHMIQQQK